MDSESVFRSVRARSNHSSDSNFRITSGNCVNRLQRKESFLRNLNEDIDSGSVFIKQLNNPKPTTLPSSILTPKEV